MKVIIAGGGTGGHLFPGIALAQRLQADSLFLCTDRPFDRQHLARYGFNFYSLPSPRFSFSPLFVIKLFSALYLTCRYFKRFQPDLVIGLGGYGAFCPLAAGLLSGVPLILLEQNLLPGKITRLFRPFAKFILCQWAGTVRLLYNRPNALISGSPMRKEIMPLHKYEAKKQLGLNKDKVLAVIGGSQGAHAINESFIRGIEYLKQFKDELSIIHIAGDADYDVVKQAYQKNGIESFVRPFYEDMAVIYSSADLVLSRSGGIAIAEMVQFGLPMVLVPYPHAAENHQFFNAREIAQKGAGLLVEQHRLPEKIPDIMTLVFDSAQLAMMSHNSQTLKLGCALPTAFKI